MPVKGYTHARSGGYTDMPLTVNKLSKRHFMDVANVFQKRFDQATNQYEHRMLLTLACDLANLYTVGNPNFDRSRFLLACGKEAPRRGGNSAPATAPKKPVTAAVKNSAALDERKPDDDDNLYISGYGY